jgi:hypothetical protein
MVNLLRIGWNRGPMITLIPLIYNFLVGTTLLLNPGKVFQVVYTPPIGIAQLQ